MKLRTILLTDVDVDRNPKNITCMATDTDNTGLDTDTDIDTASRPGIGPGTLPVTWPGTPEGTQPRSVNSRLQVLGGENSISGGGGGKFDAFSNVFFLILGAGGRLGFWGEFPPQEIAGNNTAATETDTVTHVDSDKKRPRKPKQTCTRTHTRLTGVHGYGHGQVYRQRHGH